MLVLGHTGITLGVTCGVEKVLNRPDISSRWPWARRLAGVGRRIDYRVLLVGSMLPDIIDKPLGVYLFPDTLDNGRIFAHTLVFLLVLLSIGIGRYRRYGGTSVPALAWGTFIHLLLDRMWRSPHTLLWPAFGLSFAKVGVSHFEEHIWESLKMSIYVQSGEAIGFTLLALIALRLLRTRRIRHFLRTGSIE